MKEECYEDVLVESEMKVKWSELPFLPLGTIYSFLSRKDQVSMSLVCRSWSEGYSLPSVWKTFEFNLTESQLSMETCPVMNIVHNHCRKFRHVEIVGPFFGLRSMMKNWCRYIVEFLQILTTKTQLISVKFKCRSYLFWKKDTPIYYKNICRNIAGFFASQRHLKRLEFDLCYFHFQDGFEILRNITENNGLSLTHVVLRFFGKFDPTSRVLFPVLAENLPTNLPTLADLLSLKVLEIDYSVIFENMVAPQSNKIQTMKKDITRAFSKIILNCSGSFEETFYFRGLTSNDWQTLQDLYPDLQVEFTLVTSPSSQEVEFFIVQNMPISRLEFVNETVSLHFEIELIKHLIKCKTTDHLVTLHLRWGEPFEHFSTIFSTFFHACKRLKSLELFLISPTDFSLLLKRLLEIPHESLEKVIIDVKNLDVEYDYQTLLNSTTEYVSLLKLMGLNIRVDIHN